jgi:hypothetical protein
MDLATVAATAAVTLLPRGAKWVRRAWNNRYVDPKEEHRRVFLQQADSYNERAAKLDVFGFDLSQEPKPDKWKVALSISKLDRRDQRYAVQEPDIEVLRNWAARKAAQGRDNSGECARSADEIAYRTFIFRI